jgi:hypothetical protein
MSFKRRTAIIKKDARKSEDAHSSYVRRRFKYEDVDRRTKEYKTVALVESRILQALADPTPQEEIIVGRIAFKLLQCLLFEKEFFISGKNGSMRYYLAISNSLSRDLALIGLNRRKIEKRVPELSEYIQQESQS